MLVALAVCGIMGMMGQGVRAIVGLKNAGSLDGSRGNSQSPFDAAYLALSFMIGAIAGILAGLVTGLDQFTTGLTLQKLLAIAASGYVGADFVENSMSLVLPKGAPAPQAPPPAPSPAPAEIAPVAPPPPVPSLAPAAADRFTAALHAVAPRVDIGKWGRPLEDAFARFDFGTDRRQAAAVGQFLVEAGDALSEVVEDLYYTHVEAVMRAFGPHFASEAEAAQFLRDPRKLANRVYANRLGNGDEASGDGYRYRGRGLIQLTGKDEYADFARSIGQTPEQASDLCETAEGAAMSGCWYLAARHGLPPADAWDIRMVTRLVNGPRMLGLAQRTAYSNAMLERLRG
ncbi:hypothetical protein [Methylobacterium sp. Leaf456]|uniref:glycoside hydrolase family 19 protein n=1 Tax=Methylobacterium sp. Leaf456 TaxID=1736382 RepID=UPI0012E345B4|nr:hypothetical protein [Methylobacterium sp. Leaf456]